MAEIPKGELLKRVCDIEDEMYRIPQIIDDSSERKWGDVAMSLGDVADSIMDVIHPAPSQEEREMERAKSRFMLQFEESGQIALKLANRASRLAELLRHNAPQSIVENDLELLESAYNAMVSMARRHTPAPDRDEQD